MWKSSRHISALLVPQVDEARAVGPGRAPVPGPVLDQHFGGVVVEASRRPRQPAVPPRWPGCQSSANFASSRRAVDCFHRLDQAGAGCAPRRRPRAPADGPGSHRLEELVVWFLVRGLQLVLLELASVKTRRDTEMLGRSRTRTAVFAGLDSRSARHLFSAELVRDLSMPFEDEQPALPPACMCVLQNLARAPARDPSVRLLGRGSRGNPRTAPSLGRATIGPPAYQDAGVVESCGSRPAELNRPELSSTVARYRRLAAAGGPRSTTVARAAGRRE